MKNLFKTNILIGLFAILPIVILIIVFQFIFSIIHRISAPITGAFGLHDAIGEYASALIALIVILFLLFILGVFIRTRLGRFLFTIIEDVILKKLPLYAGIQETVSKFKGEANKKPLFSQIGAVDLYGTGTYMTGFVTDETEAHFTVFVPTSPQPTTGYIFHVEKSQFILTPEVKFDDALRSVVSCGVGSEKILGNLEAAYLSAKKEKNSGVETSQGVLF